MCSVYLSHQLSVFMLIYQIVVDFPVFVCQSGFFVRGRWNTFVLAHEFQQMGLAVFLQLQGAAVLGEGAIGDFAAGEGFSVWVGSRPSSSRCHR